MLVFNDGGSKGACVSFIGVLVSFSGVTFSFIGVSFLFIRVHVMPMGLFISTFVMCTLGFENG